MFLSLKINKLKKRRHKHCKCIYAQQRSTKYIKKILEDFKKDIDSNTILLGDFNTPLSKMGRFSKQNINKDIMTLNNALDQMDLTDIYRTFHPKESKYTFFSNAHGTFSNRPHNRTQNKPQQVQENWNHVKYFLWWHVSETKTNLKGKKTQNTQ